MAVCEICGAKIGLANQAYLGVPGEQEFLGICKNCEKQLNNIKNPTIHSFEEAKEYMKPCMARQDMNKNVYNYLSQSISEADAQVKELKRRIEVQKKAHEEKAQRTKEAALKKAENLRSFKVTTGNYFEGYKVTEYIDIVSGEIVLGTGFLAEIQARVSDVFGDNAEIYEGKFGDAKRRALNIAINNALDIGANALLAIDFDILTIANNMIVTCANGTAVHIEKLEE